jgi:hypothetical protein
MAVSNQPANTSLVWSSDNTAALTIDPNTGAATRVNNFNGGVLVKATVSNACGSNTQDKNVWLGIPTAPGPVTGETAPSVGGIYQYVSSAPAQGQAYYNWTLPYNGNPVWSQSGGNINGIIDTLAPNLMVGSSSGWVQAYGVNECGPGPVSKLRVVPIVGGGGGQQQRIAVYPNPASNSLTIETTTTDVTISENESNNKTQSKKNDGHFTAKLLNQFNIEFRGGESKNGKITFDVLNLPDGMYYLHVQNGQELITKQIQIKK